MIVVYSVSLVRLLTDYEFEARRGEYDERDRDYELEHAERYRRTSVSLSF